MKVAQMGNKKWQDSKYPLKVELTGFSECVIKDKIKAQKIMKSLKYEGSVSEKGQQGKNDNTEQRKYTCLKNIQRRRMQQSCLKKKSQKRIKIAIGLNFKTVILGQRSFNEVEGRNQMAMGWKVNGHKE